MKKYKYKLEALVKLRTLKENLAKVELGKTQSRIKQLEDFKEKFEVQITDLYIDQEKSLKDGVSQTESRIFSKLVTDAKNHILRIDEELELMREKRELQIKKLAKKKSELDLIEKLKVKDRLTYKKKLNKKIQENAEDNLNSWSQIKDII